MTEAPQTTASRLVSEFVGTGFLLLSVVGSGIMAERLSPNDVGLQLLENSIATAGALACLKLLFGSTSGTHFNPAVTVGAHVLRHVRRHHPAVSPAVHRGAVRRGAVRHRRRTGDTP